MFAVIQTGGKQYAVQEGSVLQIEKISGDKGDTVSIDDVRLLASDSGTKVGRPTIDGASVSLEIVDQVKGPKVTIFKKIRRQGKQLKKGHRQKLTSVRVASISG